MSSSPDKPGLKKKLTPRTDSALKAFLSTSTRRGSAVPSAMTEGDLSQEEKVREYIPQINTTSLFGNSGNSSILPAHFQPCLFDATYKVVLTIESVDKVLKCDHSNESY